MSDSSNQPPMMGYASLSDFKTVSLPLRIRRMIVRRLFRAGIAIAILICFVGLFQIFMLGPITAVLAVVACMITTAIAAGCLRAARRQRAMIILSYCEQGARLHAPLPEFLRAVAMNESPRNSRRLLSIAETLEAPASLGSAIVSALPELPLRYGELLRAAEANQTLLPTLSRLVRDDEPEDPDVSARGSMTGAYIAINLLAIGIPVMLILIFVMPKLVEISRDFGVAMPWAWSIPRSIGPDLLAAIFGCLLILALVIALAVLSRNVQGIFFSRREYDNPFKGIVDRLLWNVPIVGGAIRDRDWADVCQVVADGLDQRRPLDGVLREVAATQHLNDVSASRVERWMIGVVGGLAPSAAARGAGMPAAVSGMIGETRLAGDALPPVFAFLARHYRARDSRRSAWLAAAAVPVLTLACGGIVTAIALFLWIPLTRLIDAVVPYPMGL